LPEQHDHHNLGGSNKLLNLAEAAAYLGLEDPLKLRRWRHQWGIPATKVGRAVKFRQRDLDAWISRQAAA
jgi:excisionase family DNA binding protein